MYKRQALFRVRDGWLAYGGALAAILATVGLLVYPRMDDALSLIHIS